jgi:hypothetical protein
MKSIDLETLYSKIKKSIQITSTYLNEPLFPQLVKSCRLKPYSIFTGFSSKIQVNKLEYHWVDEFGGSLFVEKNNISHIKLDDQSLKTATQISTDLFYGNSVSQILTKSKAVIFSADHFLFYGQDEYFRCFEMGKNNIRRSPLVSGLKNLLEVSECINQKIKYGNDYALYSLPNPKIEELVKENI